jgi:hypothetical protein
MNEDADIKYEANLTTPVGLATSTGTVSLDYGVVLEGEVELRLDGGEK